ncbi:hypothetical protein [Methanococcus maripaludis]|uniref:Major membrane immunogen (Membrane-anchored lipoprotein) n=2 Tax=Methanococcus maripaludis TaxID=39152 RepID=A0A7J9PLD9_METMI|nr:hypothetical protein [Methanococcus maripaludis]MBA2862319.1 major membrane immunogen (membrane-anchored lipoprotein) [Methanococcus maripaludis]
MTKKLVIGVFCLISILLLCGCAETDSGDQTLDEVDSNSEDVVSGGAEYIGTFYAAQTDDSLKFTLIFNDAENKLVTATGTAKLTIYDDFDNKLFEKEYVVDPSKAGSNSKYTLVVSLDDLEKGMTESGYAEVVFTSKEGKVITKIAKSIQIPYYSEEEIANIAEKEYLENAVESGDTYELDDVEITVLRSGFYTIYGEESEKIFRVDIKIENNYGQPKDFAPSEIIVYDQSENKYRHVSGGSLDEISEIPSLDTVEGYWFFEDVPESMEDPRLFFKNGRDSNGNWLVYDFTLE